MTNRMNRRSWLGSARRHCRLRGERQGKAANVARPKVAAVFTELRVRSHAFHILSSLMGPYLFRGQWTDPGVDVVSFYADQFPNGDMAREASERFKVPLFKTIDEALCLGGKTLAVDAVLLIGEHGRYPRNELGQTMYPRKEFFDQIVAVIERSGRPVPVFNDKHLSYRWDWAKQMYDDAQRLKIPFMAGSSVPLAERQAGDRVSGGRGGRGSRFDSRRRDRVVRFSCPGSHAVADRGPPRRRDGHQAGAAPGRRGVPARRPRKAAGRRSWSTAAMNAERNAEVSSGGPRLRFPAEPFVPRHAVLVTYKDGTRGHGADRRQRRRPLEFCLPICRGRAEPLATAFYSGPWGNWNLFNALSRAIAHFFKTGESPYPVERTLLVSGALDAAMHSHHDGGKVVDTPELEFAYPPKDFRAFCETGESWRVITPEMPEPRTFDPGHG